MNLKINSKTKALIGVILASLFWSTAGISKILVRSIDPYITAFIRFLISSLFLLPIFLKQKVQKQFNLKSIIPIAILSTANICFFYLGIMTSTANASTIIYSTTPLVVLVFSAIFLNEKISRQKLIGIIIGLFGAVLIGILPIFEKKQQISGDITGNILFGLAMLSWAFYTIGSRYLIVSKKSTGLQLSSISIFLSSIIFGIISFFRWQPNYFSLITQPKNILLFLHLGIFVTVVTYLLYQWSIKHSSATIASLNLYIQPVFAILFNTIFLNEVINKEFVIGSIFVFLGVLITTKDNLFLFNKKPKN